MDYKLPPEADTDHHWHEYFVQWGRYEDNDRQLYKLYQEYQRSKDNLAISHSIITISFPALEKETEREKVFEVLEKLQELKQYKYLEDKSIMFSLEFYGKELKDNNFHSHILIKGKIKDRARIIRDFSTRFKVKPNFIDVKSSRNAELYSIRENYLKGEKQDKKQEQIENDIKKRQELNIQNYYLI